MNDHAASFRPAPFLGNPHLQTIAATQVRLTRPPPSSTLLVRLDDGDQLALEVSTPETWHPGRRTVLLIHGLCGCHGSSYLVRIAKKLYRRGLRAVRMNQRGCGSGRGLARYLYHSGRSEDVLSVVRTLRQTSPESPLSVLGFSLGGNMALKLAGELGAAALEYFDQVIAVCPPANLLGCAYLISRPSSRLYDQFFVRLLRRMVAERHALFPDLGPIDLPAELTLYLFDDVYTAPQSGFRNALDYYTRSSSAPLVPEVRVSCRILFAEDDPFIDAAALDAFRLPSNVQVVRTRGGGHLGFLGMPGSDGGFRWMDSQVLRWIAEKKGSGPFSVRSAE